MENLKWTGLNEKGQEQVFLYERLGTGVNLIRYISYDVLSVTIPSFIDDEPVVAINKNCFFNHAEIEEISFPETLISIGDSAFAMCKRIKKLIIPDSVQEIGLFAFRDCKGLETVILPSGLKTLKRGVFAFCSLYNPDIRLPEGLETIETHAFYSAGLFELVIPESVKEIQPNAFEHLGPNPITSLPHDRSWYPRWPLGEIIRDDAGNTGVVKNVRHIQDEGDCCILSIAFDGKEENRFYPFGMDALTFDTEVSRKTIKDDLTSNQEKEELYKAWLRGLI